MFSETILDPEEETNRYRKYVWALMNSPKHSQPVLNVQKKIEKDPARLLATLYGALQSRKIETLHQVAAIADEKIQSLVSETARQAYLQVFNDAKRMIEDLRKAKK